MYSNEICVEGCFVSFFLVTKNVKNRSKIVLFCQKMSLIWKIDIQKKETITFSEENDLYY